MTESFIFAVNTVVPMFIIVLLGGILKKIGFLKDTFFAQSERFVFRVALPSMLFLNIVNARGSVRFDGKYVAFCCIGVTVSFILLCLIVPIFVKDNDKRGAFIQGSYRSNFAILGTTLAQNMFGEPGVVQIAMIMPFAITLYNFFAVSIMSIFAPEDKKLTKAQIAKNIGKNIITNPLIISVLLALVFLLFDLPLPTLANKSLQYLSDSSMPLALMALGANFSLESMKGRFHLAVIATFIKTVLLVVIAVGIAVMIGYRGVELGIIYILFSGPAAVSSYIMAKNMESDYQLAGQILLLSTLVCTLTLFLGVFLLKYLALI
ncbi:MAG: AEC family transporter [Clostridiales bacterium]|jgi:predicted permease|nr:AEC family transporter [Clostridiales bacterium]